MNVWTSCKVRLILIKPVKLSPQYYKQVKLYQLKRSSLIMGLNCFSTLKFVIVQWVLVKLVECRKIFTGQDKLLHSDNYFSSVQMVY